MTAQTESEIQDYLSSNLNFFGLQFDAQLRYGRPWFSPFYEHSEAKRIGFELPKFSSGIAYLAGVIPSLLTGFEDHNWTGGAVIYQDYDVWNHKNNVEGWNMIERIRMGYGELRPFAQATANIFRDTDLSIIPAFLLAPLIYGWNAYYIPQDRGSFAFISHDGYWTISTETVADYNELQKKLAYYPEDHWIRNHRLLINN